MFSFGTLIFLWSSGKNWNIFKRKFSERLAVYLAVADILYRYYYVLAECEKKTFYHAVTERHLEFERFYSEPLSFPIAH